jgi:hypothetical protein
MEEKNVGLVSTDYKGGKKYPNKTAEEQYTTTLIEILTRSHFEIQCENAKLAICQFDQLSTWLGCLQAKQSWESMRASQTFPRNKKTWDFLQDHCYAAHELLVHLKQ